MWLRSSWGRGKPKARQWLVWTFLGLEVDAAHSLRCSSRLEVWLLGDLSLRRAEYFCQVLVNPLPKLFHQALVV